jgi:hypothetical protein
MAGLWAKREKQIERVIDSIATMRGELEGTGILLPQLPDMELAGSGPRLTYIEEEHPQQSRAAPDEEKQSSL